MSTLDAVVRCERLVTIHVNLVHRSLYERECPSDADANRSLLNAYTKYWIAVKKVSAALGGAG